ncbi:hypothetical protein ACFVJ5_07515 [Nocardia sp. NPDC127606]|uniref:hypothetical protein n=1 Tax=Nocardia sp. NPDC127606 TaxID=3345406 RepID=UPI00362D0F9A
MTNQTTAPEPNPTTPQPNTLRRQILDTAATVANTAAFAADLTDHPVIATAAHATALALRILNTILDTRTAPGSPTHD